MHPRPLRRRHLAAVATAAALLAAACSGASDPEGAEPAAAAVPGALVTARPVDGPPGAPGARAWVLTYGLTAVDGQPAAATGVVAVPAGDPPPGGWPLVVWGHPTRGTADGCAPSTDGAAAVDGLEPLLEDGYAVVAPDLEGLGAPGPHPYLVGSSGAESLLRAVQAAPAIDGAGLEPGGPVALLGFSQGGHAAAFAAQEAGTRAPEVDLRGVALVAPVSDPRGFYERAEARADQVGVAVTMVGAYAAAYPDVDPADVLAPAVVADLGVLEERCIGEVVDRFTGPPTDQLVATAAEVPALAARLAENLTGQVPPGVPALVVQGADDDIVAPGASAALVERWCAAGAQVAAVVRPGATHGVPFLDVARPWLAERFAGAAADAGCDGAEVLPA